MARHLLGKGRLAGAGGRIIPVDAVGREKEKDRKWTWREREEMKIEGNRLDDINESNIRSKK